MHPSSPRLLWVVLWPGYPLLLGSWRRRVCRGAGWVMARVPVFRCLFCEHCCYFSSPVEYPTVFPREKRLLEEIAERRGVRVRFEPLLVFRDRDGRCVVGLYRWVVPGFCPFFDRGSKRCTIHEVKPLACRMYPLIVEMPSGRLMVSGKCDWVRMQGPSLLRRLEADPRLIARVFPREFEAAKEAFAEFMDMQRVVEELGLQRVSPGECGGGKLYDLDEYVAAYG